MKHYLNILVALLIASNAPTYSQIIYTPSDSIKIEAMLRDGLKQPKSTNLVLYYGLQFQDVPYVAHTLEVPYNTAEKEAIEQLVINMQQPDCTTFVETVLALTRTTLQEQHTFSDYCRNLTLFRYWGGEIKDYPSRNHYFTTWIDNALNQGLVKQLGPANSPLFAWRNQKIDFMTKHPSYYAALCTPKKNIYLQAIAEAERLISRKVCYLPTIHLGKSQNELHFIHDGDILALETTKNGLDVSHLGIAVWGKDGKLHLLNASSIHKKVIMDPLPLVKYQQKQRTQIGIRIIRPN